MTSFTEDPVSHAMNVLKRDVSRMPAIPKTRSFVKPDDVLRDVAHRVERIRHDDDHRVGAVRHDLLGNRADDLLVRCDEVITAHPGRARQPCGDHDDLRPGRLLVTVGADDGRLEAEYGAHLVDVERLSLRKVLLDVDEDDVRVVAGREHLRAGGADVACADHSGLRSLWHRRDRSDG